MGASEKTKRKYEQYYERIGLRKWMWSVFYQYYKYGQVFAYLMNDGRLITLPPHRCRITNVMVDGEPVVEFEAKAVVNELERQTGSAWKQWIEDDTLKTRLSGYPEEVAAGIAKNAEWVQLNPSRTCVMQGVKEDWLRYSVPMVAACLPAFAKKALIEAYETTALNMGAHAFLHVRYGDEKVGSDYLPNRNELGQVNTLFKQAMNKQGGGIATTNPWAKAQFVQPEDVEKLFENDLYAEVNSEILSIGGISGIIVSGRAEDGSSFASAQVSMQTAGLRIKQARDNFCALMNKINRMLNEGILPHSAGGKVPVFTFPPIDLTGGSKMYETCYKLWVAGAISTKTMLSTHGYDMEQEIERRRTEDADGTTQILVPRENGAQAENENANGKVGRPEMDDSERRSDPADSVTGKQPKPSAPEGSA